MAKAKISKMAKAEVEERKLQAELARQDKQLADWSKFLVIESRRQAAITNSDGSYSIFRATRK